MAEAENGLVGAEACESQSFALLLLDVNMPRMNGLDMLKKVRELPNYASTPVCFLTTESPAEHRKRAKSLGVTAWSVKPFKKDALLQGVAMILERAAKA